MLHLPTDCVAYNAIPKGGVSIPIIKFTTTITPKCMELIPAAWATGNKIGTKIRIDGEVSMNIPQTKSMILIINKTEALLWK